MQGCIHIVYKKRFAVNKELLNNFPLCLYLSILKRDAWHFLNQVMSGSIRSSFESSGIKLSRISLLCPKGCIPHYYHFIYYCGSLLQRQNP